MNPWEIWLWPWIVASALTRRALETVDGSMEANDGDAALPRVSELEWASPNDVTIELDAMRVRDFSVARGKQRSTLIVAPFALHDARIADLSSGHSLIETLRANGCSRLFLVEWKSATAKIKLPTIDSHLCDLNVVVDDIGPPVDLIGLCQGGWLSLVYAARFTQKVRRLVLAGAPIDLMAEPSIPSAEARMTPEAAIDDMIRAGDGLVLGRTLLRSLAAGEQRVRVRHRRASVPWPARKRKRPQNGRDLLALAAADARSSRALLFGSLRLDLSREPHRRRQVPCARPPRRSA